MDLDGEQRIAAPRDTVWAALNDLEILKRSIPGCESLERTSDTTMAATAMIKVGPVSARFAGQVSLSELDPPNGYRIEGEGQGGAAGFAKGGASVRLEADGEETLLRYTVTAQVGGKLSQLGGRLITATARQMSAAFFQRFAEEIAERTAPASPAPQALEPAPIPLGAAALAQRRPTSWAMPVATFVGLALVAWALSAHGAGSAAQQAPAAIWATLAVLAGAVGYLLGRRAAPTVVIDPALAAELLAAWNAKRR